MARTTGTLLVLLLIAAPAGWCQTNNKPVQAGNYYMDSNADCNGPVREIYGQTVKVHGHGAIQEQLGPQSCTITLRSSGTYDYTNLRIEVVAATIRDCNTHLTIYDGMTDQSVLNGYDCHTQAKQNERDFITTGDTVSFLLSRRETLNALYDIQIYITPLISGNKPGYENDYGDAWGYHREKLENDDAITIVGAVFLVTIILILLGVLLCYRRYRGFNKPWEQHQLSSFQPETSTIYETKSKMTDNSSGIWASNMSRSQAQPASRRRIEPTRHMARPSEDEDSVFDGEPDTPPKKQLMERDRREREREQERQRGHRREYATQNNSFVGADDDHPQDTFVERIIEPRVRPSRVYKPPPYDEAINSDTEKSEEEEDDADHKETSEEEASEEPTSEEEEEEEEEEEQAAATLRPRQHPGAIPPYQHGMMPPPPGAYPGYPPPMGYMGGYPTAHPGQFVPIVAAPPPPVAQPYPPTQPPPRYPGDRVRPTDPPIYSYLVQRGYTPLDVAGRNSPASQANTSQASMDEPDKNVLASGVEYMRR